MAAWRFISIYKKNKSKVGINLKVVGVIFIAILILFFSNYYMAFFTWAGSGSYEMEQDPMPAGRTPLSTFTNNSEIELNNNFVLQDNENIYLFNTTLTFNCTYQKEYTIWIDDRATLKLINCTGLPNAEFFF